MHNASVITAALASGNLFSNPCYSRVVGSIGPWYADELSTCPEGRYLATANPDGTIYILRLADPGVVYSVQNQ